MAGGTVKSVSERRDERNVKWENIKRNLVRSVILLELYLVASKKPLEILNIEAIFFFLFKQSRVLMKLAFLEERFSDCVGGLEWYLRGSWELTCNNQRNLSVRGTFVSVEGGKETPAI